MQEAEAIPKMCYKHLSVLSCSRRVTLLSRGLPGQGQCRAAAPFSRAGVSVTKQQRWEDPGIQVSFLGIFRFFLGFLPRGFP